MTATLLHRNDPRGERLKALFRNTVYVEFDWTIAKAFNFFPPVEYLEFLPTLRSGRDVPTYASLLAGYSQVLKYVLDRQCFRLGSPSGRSPPSSRVE